MTRFHESVREPALYQRYSFGTHKRLVSFIACYPEPAKAGRDLSQADGSRFDAVCNQPRVSEIPRRFASLGMTASGLSDHFDFSLFFCQL
jgi:hypothetical protein